jgi:hypothetical protein
VPRIAWEPTTMTSGCWMIWQAVRGCVLQLIASHSARQLQDFPSPMRRRRTSMCSSCTANWPRPTTGSVGWTSRGDLGGGRQGHLRRCVGPQQRRLGVQGDRRARDCAVVVDARARSRGTLRRSGTAPGAAARRACGVLFRSASRAGRSTATEPVEPGRAPGRRPDRCRRSGRGPARSAIRRRCCR